MHVGGYEVRASGGAAGTNHYAVDYAVYRARRDRREYSAFAVLGMVSKGRFLTVVPPFFILAKAKTSNQYNGRTRLTYYYFNKKLISVFKIIIMIFHTNQYLS